MYNIIDNQTQTIVATATNLKRASAKAEKLNQAYGAVRYTYRFA